MMKYLYLALAILLEVTGSSFLQVSKGFSKPVPTIVMVLAYIACFFFLSQALKYIPLGIAYAIWAGLGIVLTAAVSVLIFKQTLDLPAVLGMLLIISGVIVINAFSKTAGH